MKVLLSIVVLLVSACTEQHPDADEDIAWARSNGLDETPNGWDKTGSEELTGYVDVADSSATIVTRNYAAAGSADELTTALTDAISERRWQQAWWTCDLTEARFGFLHPDREDVFLDAKLNPIADGVDVTVRAVFDRQGWTEATTESTNCFVDVIERAELKRTLPPIERLSPEEIEARLTANEAAAILDLPNIESRSRDLHSIEYLVGDDWVLAVGGLSFQIPEFDGRGRNEVYLVSEQPHANIYRVGLGDNAVELSDYTKTEDMDLINRLAEELRQ